MNNEQIEKVVRLDHDRFTLKRSIANLQEEIKDYEATYGSSEELTSVAKFEAHLHRLGIFIGQPRLGRIDATALYTDLNKVLTEHRDKLLSDMQRSLEIIEEELDKL